MDLLTKTRTTIITQLWQQYSTHLPQTIDRVKKYEQPIVLDHFAIIDLPSEHSGISTLTKIFTALGYHTRGQGYLAEKQNDFAWLAPTDASQQKATAALPQIVVADFRIEELSNEVQIIVKKYTSYIKPFDFATFNLLLDHIHNNDVSAETMLVDLVVNYCQQKEWPALSTEEFNTVKKSNELLAWVLAFGRCINHFGLSIHHTPTFNNLQEWNNFMQLDDAIKGGEKTGIAQSSTKGEIKNIVLANGNTTIHGPFMEFVWRYAKKDQPYYWQDYFTDFVDYQANRVIEAVYE